MRKLDLKDIQPLDYLLYGSLIALGVLLPIGLVLLVLMFLGYNFFDKWLLAFGYTSLLMLIGTALHTGIQWRQRRETGQASALSTFLGFVCLCLALICYSVRGFFTTSELASYSMYIFVYLGVVLVYWRYFDKPYEFAIILLCCCGVVALKTLDTFPHLFPLDLLIGRDFGQITSFVSLVFILGLPFWGTQKAKRKQASPSS
jgi:hypothetical protein